MKDTAQKRIFTSVRPARVAVLIDQRDEDWQQSCMRVIEFFSGAWGGAYNILVPTDGSTITQRFWDILSAYDADYIYFYYRTGNDLKINHPEKYKKWLEQEVNSFASRGEIDDLESTRRQIDGLLMSVDFVSEPIAELQAQLIKRLAPFHFAERAIEKGIAAGSLPDFPLTPLTKVVANSEPIRNLLIYEPKYDGIYALWLASVTGLVTDLLRSNLLTSGVSASTFSPFEYRPLSLMIDNREAVRYRIQNNFATPFDLANTNTALYRSTKSFSTDGPIVIVAGESLQDFCLFYSLSRLRALVTWLPQLWLASNNENPDSARPLLDVFADELKDLSRRSHVSTSPKYLLTSHSMSTDELDSVITELDKRGFSRTERFKDVSSVTCALDSMLEDPLRLYERDNAYRPSSLVIQEGGQIDFFDTPKPKNFVRLDPYEHRWITEVSIVGHRLPRHANLGEWIVRHPVLSSHGARIGKSAISYFCPSSMYFGGDIDTTLIRPSVFVPDALQTFEYLFKKVGYEASLSDKGFFARDTISKFGDLRSIGALLRTSGTRELLFKFLDHVRPAHGVHDEGALLNDKRRYMNFPSITKLIGSEDTTQTTVEALMMAHILYRGFVFKCRNCRNTDWFGLEETSQMFKCKRCGRNQHITVENYWYGSKEPGFYYKLDEIVYQFLRHHGYVTLLALDHLRIKSEESFLYSPDLELSKSGSRRAEMELDILCIRDGRMTLGEAKKENRLGKNKREETMEIRKYVQLATQIGAVSVIFATFSKAWSNETMKNIAETINDPHIEVSFLARSDLLNESAEL